MTQKKRQKYLLMTAPMFFTLGLPRLKFHRWQLLVEPDHTFGTSLVKSI
jgi:hypothetical protein